MLKNILPYFVFIATFTSHAHASEKDSEMIITDLSNKLTQDMINKKERFMTAEANLITFANTDVTKFSAVVKLYDAMQTAGLDQKEDKNINDLTYAFNTVQQAQAPAQKAAAVVTLATTTSVPNNAITTQAKNKMPEIKSKCCSCAKSQCIIL